MTRQLGELSCLRLPELKGYLNSDLLERALGSTGPILLHDQVEIRVVHLSPGNVPLLAAG